MKEKDFFNKKSQVYENDVKRVDNVKNIALGIKKAINLNSNHVFLDFGSGTGLLTEYISKDIKKIIANDISKTMNQKLEEKIKEKKFICDVEIVSKNIIFEEISVEPLDGIISSMTIHHVKDVKSLMGKFFKMLKAGGIIALSDLELEDGSFHTEDTGVYHFGFDKEYFFNLAKSIGFVDLKIETVSVAEKPYGKYPIFLLTGVKPS